MGIQKVRNVNNVKALVVDDEPALAEFIGETLHENGYIVDVYSDPSVALEALNSDRFDLALIDINMPGISGIEMSKRIIDCFAKTEIIIITGVPDENNLDPCLKMGLTHFLFKPFNESQLVYSAYAALHHKRLRRELDTAIFGKAANSDLVGISQSTRKIRKDVLAIARTEIPALILGPSGTGKEVIARDIHNNSSRREGPFIPINCAILGDLAETELFGHVKGAFTGASQNTSGYIGAAEGGSLFLDEVGELSMGVQAKLLRFLDNGDYSKVGEAKLRNASVRIIAATNQDIVKMVGSKSFREDLYYRLQGTIIQTTSLDTRKSDILPLIYHFLDMFGRRDNTLYEISEDGAAALVNASWPGNVRQLKQMLYKITQLASSRKIGLADVRQVLGEEVENGLENYQQAKRYALNQFDREYFIKTLSLSEGNLQKALQLTGMHKKNFYSKLKDIGLSLKDFSPTEK